MIARLRNWTDEVVDSRATTGDRFIENFDGLRAIAALLVLVMHLRTVPGLASGAPGVLLFFALSGYLLYAGFLSATREFNSTTIIAYWVRRIFRIMPLFVVFIFTYAFLFKGWTADFKETWFLAHFYFLSANLHLWTIRSELVFYLFLPLLVVLLLPYRSERTRFWLLIAAAALTWWIIERQQWIKLVPTGNLFAGFIVGMAAVHVRTGWNPRVASLVAWCSFAAILFLSWFHPLSEPVREFFGILSRPHMYAYTYAFYPLCFLMVASLAQFRSPFWGNRWLRLLGVSGFGIYIWHPLVIAALGAGLLAVSDPGLPPEPGSRGDHLRTGGTAGHRSGTPLVALGQTGPGAGLAAAAGVGRATRLCAVLCSTGLDHAGSRHPLPCGNVVIRTDRCQDLSRR